MEDKTLSPGEALWLLNNLPQTPPPGVMPTAWVNHRKKITAKLQRIIDAASREADYRINERQFLMVLGILVKNTTHLPFTQLAQKALKEFRFSPTTQGHTPAAIQVNVRERAKLPETVAGILVVGSDEIEPDYLRVVTEDIPGVEA